jgi:hypothetical protein
MIGAPFFIRCQFLGHVTNGILAASDRGDGWERGNKEVRPPSAIRALAFVPIPSRSLT